MSFRGAKIFYSDRIVDASRVDDALDERERKSPTGENTGEKKFQIERDRQREEIVH